MNYCYGLASFVVRRQLTSSSQNLLSIFQKCTYILYSNDELEILYQNCKFRDPWCRGSSVGCGHFCVKVKKHYFYEISSYVLLAIM